MRLLVLLLLFTLAFEAMRRAAARDGDVWMRTARRVLPILADTERGLRDRGMHEEADRIVACIRTVRGWRAPL